MRSPTRSPPRAAFPPGASCTMTQMAVLGTYRTARCDHVPGASSLYTADETASPPWHGPM
jgi:hypothetical protein